MHTSNMDHLDEVFDDGDFVYVWLMGDQSVVCVPKIICFTGRRQGVR